MTADRVAAVPGDALAVVRDYLARDRHLIVGLMTGTSGDALDAALVAFEGLGLETRPRVETAIEIPLEAGLRREVLATAAAAEVAPERLMRLDAALGECYAAGTLELLARAGVASADVDAIGLHGQTVRHLPRGRDGSALSLQLGSAAVVAERTGLTVVSGFRQRDTAAGGEGAPLVAIVDWWLARSDAESRALVNLGGMANVTFLPRGARLDAVRAFDTGPGNAVIDALAGLASGGAESRDEKGRRAARGAASEPLLAEALADPFFGQPPPRSTGRERFGQGYAERLRATGVALGLSDDDVIATAVELTAASIARAFRDFGPEGGVEAAYLSGGGVRNPSLVAAITRRLTRVQVRLAEELGLPSDAKEAMAFAFLAHQTLSGRAGNVPSATGASHPVPLGHITPGAMR